MDTAPKPTSELEIITPACTMSPFRTSISSRWLTTLRYSRFSVTSDETTSYWSFPANSGNTEKKREALFDEICEKALAYRIIFVGPEVIDRENILNATMGGMQQAVEELDIVPNLVLVDGNRTPAGLQIPAQPVVKGDATSASIGAASVLAKVSRDRYMLELDKQYPQYQLAKHKGYPTKLHYELIAQYGIQPFYRRSFLKKQGYWPESGK